VLSDPRSLDHESIYTGLSRGRGDNHLYWLGRPEPTIDYDVPQAAKGGGDSREALLRGMIRSRETRTALDMIDALERGELDTVTQVIAAEVESTLTHAGVPLTLDTEAELVEVPAAAAGLEYSEVEAAIRTHSGDPLPEPEAEATAAIVARTKAKDQADAQAERDRTDHGPNADDERPRRRRDRRREQELKP
jgi:hypothetical protein